MLVTKKCSIGQNSIGSEHLIKRYFWSILAQKGVFRMFFLLQFACKAPPPAPEGLDAVTSYMVREFYAEDEIFEAGIQGFMNWFNTDGYLLVGESASDSNTDTFSLNDLSEQDIAHLPLTEDSRDYSRAKGVISLANMDCSWKSAESYLLRNDQDIVFAGDWESYDRTYINDRSIFSAATETEEFPDITDPINPFSDDFIASDFDSNIMMTINQADPTPLLGIDIPAYDLFLDFRHGKYTIDETEIGVVAIITYQKEGVYDDGGNNGLAQTYSIELNIEQNGSTLRALAVWAEPVSNIIEPDSPLSLNYAVNKSLASSERISAICSGEEDIPAEE
jgi:hypothetical protein